MYRQRRLAPTESSAFSSFATWTPGADGWSGVLPADPVFEILWTAVGSDVASPPVVVAPVPRPAFAEAGPAKPATEGPVLQILRVRPAYARALFGVDADELARSTRVTLADLGPSWREIARLTETEALLGSLLGRGRETSPPEIVLGSLATLAPGGPDATPNRRLTGLREIAKEHGYSYEQWLRTMKRSCGVAPATLRAHVRLRRATEIARTLPSLGMDEIAWRSGYSEASVLARASLLLAGRPFRPFVAAFSSPD